MAAGGARPLPLLDAGAAGVLVGLLQQPALGGQPRQPSRQAGCRQRRLYRLGKGKMKYVKT